MMIGDPIPPNFQWVKPFDFSILPSGKTALWVPSSSEWAIIDTPKSTAN